MSKRRSSQLRFNTCSYSSRTCLPGTQVLKVAALNRQLVRAFPELKHWIEALCYECPLM